MAGCWNKIDPQVQRCLDDALSCLEQIGGVTASRTHTCDTSLLLWRLRTSSSVPNRHLCMRAPFDSYSDSSRR
jgi:hypothetical protein